MPQIGTPQLFIGPNLMHANKRDSSQPSSGIIGDSKQYLHNKHESDRYNSG